MIYREGNGALEDFTGMKDLVGKKASEALPNLEQAWLDALTQVYKTGKPLRAEGFSSDLARWFTYQYSRIGEAGSPFIGVVFNDITERKRREQQQAYLLKLADALRPLSDAVEIQRTAMRVLGEQLQVDRVLYAEVDDDGKTYSISANYTRGAYPELLGRFPTNDYGAASKGLGMGEVFAIENMTSDQRLSETTRAAFMSFDVYASIGVPLVKAGRWVANLGIQHGQARQWTEEEITLVKETAERTWAAVERAKAEEALRRADERYRTMTDNAPVLIWETDESGGTFANRYYTDFFGVSFEEILAMGWTKLLHPDDAEGYIATYQKAFERREPYYYECRFLRADGEYRWLLNTGHPVGEKRFVGFSADITERKRAEETLRKSESRLAKDLADAKQLQQFSNEVIHLDALSEIYEMLLHTAMKLMQSDFASLQLYSAETEMLSLVGHKNFHPESAAFWSIVSAASGSVCGEALRQQSRIVVTDVETEDFAKSELEIFRLSGIRAVQSTPILSSNGNLIGMLNTQWKGPRSFSDDDFRFFDVLVRLAADLIERRQTEKALRESEEKYRTLFESIDDGFVIVEMIYDDTGKPVDFIYRENNPALIKHVEMDLRGKRRSELSLDKKDFLLEKYEHVITTGQPIHFEYNVEKLGGQWFEATAARIGEEGSRLIGVIFRNVTDRKAAEKNLQDLALTLEQQAEELAQIGSWEYNKDSGAFIWSEGMCRLLGKTPGQQVQPEVYLEYATEGHKAAAEKVVRLIKKAGQSFEETLHLLVDGIGKIIRIKATVIQDDGNGQQKMIGVNLDITGISTAEEKIRESQNLLRQTTLASPDAITLYDVEQRKPVYLNDRLPSWLGYTRAQLEEMSFEQRLQLVHPADREGLLAFSAGLRIAEDNEVQSINYRLKTGEGIYMWVCNRSRPFTRNEQNLPRYVLSVLQDITSEVELRQQLLERSNYIESLVDASIDRICVYDRNYTILSWNRRFEEMVGVSKEDALGKNFKTLFPKLFENKTLGNAMEQVFGGEMVHLPPQKAAYAKGFHERFYIPIKDAQGETYAVLLVVHDVTETMTQQQRLKELNQTLEQQNRDLEAKNEEIISFAFVASHDLKEPIRKLQTFTDLLVHKENNNLSASGKDLLQRMEASIKHLGFLMADILELSRVGAENKGFAQTDLNKVVAQTLSDLHEQILHSGAEVLCEKLPIVRAIEKQVFYLFKNLIANAIKFQEPGNKPRIVISATKVAGTAVPGGDAGTTYHRISVADNGIGFDTQYKKKSFQVFRRLHSRSDYTGTGIGLAICRKVMENHRGLIDVESEPGKGATFLCYFPL